MRSRKGVELGVNTMIIVVIALLVLIIVGYLIIKAAGNSGTQTSCNQRGGICKSACAEGEIPSAFSCKSTEGKYCCVPLGS